MLASRDPSPITLAHHGTHLTQNDQCDFQGIWKLLYFLNTTKILINLIETNTLTKLKRVKYISSFSYYSKLNNRRLTFEYLLLKNVNDSKKNADELKDLLKGMNAYINLIPYNKVKEKDFETSDEENALRFYDLLKKNGVAVTLRQKKGDDIDAACGQLRANNLK